MAFIFILLILVWFLFYVDISKIARAVSSGSIIISHDASAKLSTPLVLWISLFFVDFTVNIVPPLVFNSGLVIQLYAILLTKLLYSLFSGRWLVQERCLVGLRGEDYTARFSYFLVAIQAYRGLVLMSRIYVHLFSCWYWSYRLGKYMRCSFFFFASAP